MKITIEEEGREPQILSGLLGYQLIVTDAEETRTLGSSSEAIGLFDTLTMAQAIEKLYNKFMPFIEMRKSLGLEAENMSDGDT